MPPLEDITRRFVQSPLPPSSSPALSYIDEVKEKQNPSSAFLALSTSPARPLAPERDSAGSDKLSFEVYDEFDHRPPSAFASNPIFSTPTSKLTTTRAAPLSPGDPFGFLAAERKLKLDRIQDRDGAPKRNPTRSRRPGQPSEPLEPHQRKRQKLDPSATPGKHVPPTLDTPFALPSPSTHNRPAKQKPTLGRVSNAHAHAQTTPISRPPTADIRTLAPPPVTPLHRGRRRRRSTALLLFDDEERNPFIVDSCDIDVPSTPSPVKRPSARSRHDGDEGDKVTNDENVNPFRTPTFSMPPSAFSSAASPKRRRRKRGRAEEEVEGLDEGNVTFSALVDEPAALRARLPKMRTTKETVDIVTPVKKRSRREVTQGKSDKEAEVVDAGYGEDEENVKEVKGVRRSTRLSKQGPLADSNKGKKTKAGKKTTTRATKGKGKENAGGASKKTPAATKGKGKAKDRPRVDEAQDDVETVSLWSACVRSIDANTYVLIAGEGASCEACVFQKD